MEITRTGATLNPAMDRTLEPKKAAGEQKTDAQASAATTASADGEAQVAEDASNLKSFAYGALDLDEPDEQAAETDSAYTAGKWLGAAAKVGAVISMLV